MSELVERFNEHGLAALAIAAGRGRKPTYTSEQEARILAEVQREPDRKAEQTATWSLMSLRAALRKPDLPEIAAERYVKCYMRPATATSTPAPGCALATRCGCAQAGP